MIGPFASAGRAEESITAWRRSTNWVKLSLSACFMVDHGAGLATILQAIRMASLAVQVVTATSGARRC